MTTTVQFTPQGSAIMVSGALNREGVPAAWRQRQQWIGTDELLTLDLKGVESVDSAGLAMLIQLKAELLAAGRDLALQNTNEQLRAFAAVSGVTDLLSLS